MTPASFQACCRHDLTGAIRANPPRQRLAVEDGCPPWRHDGRGENREQESGRRNLPPGPIRGPPWSQICTIYQCPHHYVASELHTSARRVEIAWPFCIPLASKPGSSAKEASADVVLAFLADRDINGTISNTRMALRKLR